MYDPLVDLYDGEPLRAVVPLLPEETNALLASALEATTNPIVNKALVAAVFQRELPKGENIAMREALRYVSTVENYATKQPTKHTDLLPTGHPLNDNHLKTREDIASYFSQTVEDPIEQKLLYSIIASAPSSTKREYLTHSVRPDQYAILAAVEASEKSVPFEELDWEPPVDYIDELEKDINPTFYEFDEITGERTEFEFGDSPDERMPYYEIYFSDPDPEKSMEDPDVDDE